MNTFPSPTSINLHTSHPFQFSVICKPPLGPHLILLLCPAEDKKHSSPVRISKFQAWTFSPLLVVCKQPLSHNIKAVPCSTDRTQNPVNVLVVEKLLDDLEIVHFASDESWSVVVETAPSASETRTQPWLLLFIKTIFPAIGTIIHCLQSF